MHTKRTIVAEVALCALFVSLWMLPDAAASEGPREPAMPLAEMTLSAGHVGWQPTIEYERVVLTVAGPGDLLIRRELDAGQTPSLTLSAGDGNLLPDGMYTYELRFVQRAGRPSGQPLVLSGYLSVQDGAFVTLPSDKSEAVDEPHASASSGVRNIAAEQTISEDLIVEGELTVQHGACIGESCEEGDEPSFLRLNGSITRIIFDDPPDGFTAAHSWELWANAPLGGGEFFTLLDQDTFLRPFTIEGDSPANALYVRNNGNLGLGTATPAQDIHAMSGNTPTLRLEQDGSSARIWDIGANHTELFVKDVTNSSSVPFRIKAGAPGDSLVIASDGRMGIGTAIPALARLDVRSSFASEATARLTSSSPTGYPGIEYFDNTGNSGLFFGLDNAAFTTRLNSVNNRPIVILTNFVERMRVTSAGNVGIGTTTPAAALHVGAGEVRFPPGAGAAGFTHFNFSGNGQNYIRGTTVLADTGGMVGIGTPSPVATLHVASGEVRIPGGTASANGWPTHFRFPTDGRNYIRGTTVIADDGGNVAIGTQTVASGARLTVNGGNVHVIGGAFVDDGTTLNAPDYVFEPDYKLMPLSDLAAYVQREQHLPNVPSAVDIKANGLNLSQFQMRLLEKIEELALYTLQQEEGLQSLRDENRELKARLEALEAQTSGEPR